MLDKNNNSSAALRHTASQTGTLGLPVITSKSAGTRGRNSTPLDAIT